MREDSERIQFLEDSPETLREVETTLSATEGESTWSDSDLGNAKRLVARHGSDLRYCFLWGKWLVWNGSRWQIDQSGEIIRRAKDTVLSLYEETHEELDETRRKRLAKWAIRSESEARIRAMISLAESEPSIPVEPTQLDTDPWLLNVTNGTVDLRTGKLNPHRREDLITKQIPFAYDQDASCPRWLDFLTEITAENLQLVNFLQRAAGYALTGDTREQCFFLLHGAGANGKSTFLEVLRSLMGDYACQSDFNSFLVRRDEGIRNDLARLAGARFVTAVEAQEGRRLSESVVKQITGQDTITARFLHREFFDFKPQFTLFLGTNHKPVIRGTDNAIWRRVRLVPFSVTIPPEKQDKGLGDKLRKELPGILNWAIQGCLGWQKYGLEPPEVVSEATADYKSEMDILGNFLDDRCLLDDSESQVRAKDIYSTYLTWCDENKERPLSQMVFGTKLTERGLVRSRGAKGVRVYVGVGLKTAGDG